MSFLPFEEFIIKEEQQPYISNDSKANIYNPLVTEDPTRKCGEIFLGREGVFTLVCVQCMEHFSDFQSFGNHVLAVHVNPVTKNESLILTSDQKPYSMPEPEEKPTDHFIELSNTSNSSIDVKPIEMITSQNQPSQVEMSQPEQTMSVRRMPNDATTPLSGVKGQKRSKNDPCEKGDKPDPENRTKSIIYKFGKLYCCFSCSKIYYSLRPLRKHYRSQHPDMIEKDEPVTHGSPISQQEQNFTPKIPKLVSCKYCVSEFEDINIFLTHIEQCHRTKAYKCPHCPKIFEIMAVRDNHLNSHEGIKPYKCPHCPQAFTYSSNLKVHVNIHLNIRPYECQYCGMKHAQNSDRIIHERIHTNELPFQCEECGKAYKAQVQLTKHKRKHANIKSHKCSICEKAFFSSTFLKQHMITHTQERPFSCNICHRTFRSRSNLDTHKMVHSGTKRYKCKICDKAYAQYSGLYSHRKTHEPI